MTMTTDLEGGMFGPSKEELAAAARVQAAREAAAGEVEAARLRSAAYAEATARERGDIRGTGLLTKYRPIGGWANERGGVGASGEGGSLRAAAGATELGAPTSFKAGAGAPEPIGVIRGMKQTYAPLRQAGQQFIEGEYATPLQARQAFNRARGVGVYEPPEGPKLRAEAEAKLSPLMRAEESKANLGKYMTAVYGLGIGKADQKTGEFAFEHPDYERIVQKHSALAATDPVAAQKAVTEELGVAKLKIKYDRPEVLGNLATTIKEAIGEDLTPRELVGVMQGIQTGNPEVLKRVEAAHNILARRKMEADIKGQAERQLRIKRRRELGGLEWVESLRGAAGP